MMQALSGTHCTDVRLYTLGIKIGIRIMSTRQRLHCLTRLRICAMKISVLHFDGQIGPNQPAP